MAPYDPSSISPDWDYLKQQQQTAWQNSLNQWNTKKSNALANFGLEDQGTYGPNGNGLDFNINRWKAGSENGAIQTLLRNYGQGILGAQDSSGSRGFSGGLANQREAGVRDQMGLAKAGLETQETQQLQGLNAGVNQGYNQFQGNLTGLQHDQREYNQNEQLWNTQNPGPVAPDVGATAAQKAAKAAAQSGKTPSGYGRKTSKGGFYRPGAPKPNNVVLGQPNPSGARW